MVRSLYATSHMTVAAAAELPLSVTTTTQDGYKSWFFKIKVKKFDFFYLNQIHSATTITIHHDKSEILVLGRLSYRNRKSTTLATIERNWNRDISKGMCDFDHIRCTSSVLR